MKAAADCNNLKVSFPMAKIYFDVEGMTSRVLSDDSWIQMRVRNKAGYEPILSPPPWYLSPKLGSPQRYNPSSTRRSLLRFQALAVPGRS